MTATQVIVLVLLFAAFAIGWIARGAGRRGGGYFEAVIEEGADALDAAQTACEAALRGDDAELDAAGAGLRAARRELADQVGPGSPLVEDIESARDALTLLTTWVRDGAAAEARPLANVVRDARIRYRRTATAIEQLPE